MTTSVARDIERAAEALRTANHSTMRDRHLDAPKAYLTVGALAELIGRLPQVLDHITRSLRRADATEHYDDRGTDPIRALMRADEDLLNARHEVDALLAHLNSAHNHLGHLGHHLPED